MDKASPKVRKYIAQRAELLGAIRLPNDTFTKNAGTEVTSDILFLQKREDVYKRQGESHIIVTDTNGYASTSASWNPHTQNTNAGKTSEDGIWFGEAEPNNEKGALIYDDYEVEELRCEANEGMNLIKVKVSVYKDAVTVPLGTMTDDYIEIKTTAKDEASDSQLGKMCIRDRGEGIEKKEEDFAAEVAAQQAAAAKK